VTPTSVGLAARCAADGEFRLASRYWTGGLRLVIDEAVAAITLTDGVVSAGDPGERDGVITLTGSSTVWTELLAAVPRPFFNDIAPAQAMGLRRSGLELTYWQYSPAIQRAVELLRSPATADPDKRVATRDVADPPRFDSPVGRYVHLDLDGHDHRVYFEEAGQGIAVLLQHTAGSHGTQWRHLFECAAITDRFRLIAYDLPFHGKSIPPTTRRWWTEQYRLSGAFLRQVPMALSRALALDRPVFMGCSVGGLLALDLAARHPEAFRAVVSLEGALKVDGNPESLLGFWHPQVSNETKARMMEGLTSPTSPEALRKETTQTYAAGWPQAFLGDLHYYLVDYDLRELSGSIDTTKVGVHILSGEYDYSASPAMGRAAHEAIAGSTFATMEGVGHFPMSENPDVFLAHLLPILDRIASTP
jgi:pimeloyl-ACP methyl ester carboxylesterase